MSSKSSTFFVLIGCLSFVIGIPVFLYFFFTKGIGIASLYGFLFFIGMLTFAGIGGTMEEKKKTKQRNILFSMKPPHDNFQDSLSYVSDDLRTKMTIDSVNKHLFIWAPEDDAVKEIAHVKLNMPYKIYRYSFENILAVELVEDDVIIEKIKRKSESAKFWLESMPSIRKMPIQDTSHSNKIKKISLKLLMQGHAKPIYWIHFYNNKSQALEKHSEEYKQIQTDLQQWLTAFHFIIKDADKKDGYIAFEDDEQENPSVSNTMTTEKELIIQTKLIPLLQLVSQQKMKNHALLHKEYEPSAPTSSYFNDLLNKNREMMDRREKDD